MRARQRLGVALLAVAVAVVGLGVWQPWRAGTDDGSAHLQTVHGVIGSEKRDFFDDPEVQAAFASHGLRVEVETAGSREIATTYDLTGLDFGFPSSTPVATALAAKAKAERTWSPFSSPMVVFTWKPVAAVLRQAGVMREDGGAWSFDVRAYLKLAQAHTRWRDLPGAAGRYDSPRSVLIGSTDIRTSNSAAMYMAILSYELNGEDVVTSRREVDQVVPELRPLFVGQGFAASSSDEPFKDYLAQGAGSKPLVAGYEAQFVGQRLSDPGSVPADAVMAYLSPTVFSKHVVVPFTSAGDQVGRLLTEDPTLQALAARHGFRTQDTALADLTRAHKIAGFRADIVDVADTPTYDIQEALIEGIAKGYS